MQESIIVYRNPLEKMFWESFGSLDGIMIIYILSANIGVGLGLYTGALLVEKFEEQIGKFKKIVMILSAILGAYLGFFLIKLAITW